MELAPEPVRDVLRSVGALLLAGGAITLEIRKAPTWDVSARMLVALIPAALLYGLALTGVGESGRGARADADPWRSVVAVVAVILNSVWLTLFFRWVGAHGALVTIPAFVLTAASAAFAAWRANVRFAALLAALDIVIAWLAVWNKLIRHLSGTTNRWLLMAIGVGLAAFALSLARRGRREASEVVTAAGFAGVLAASAGVFNDLLGFSLNRAVRAVGLAHSVGGFDVRQRFSWDLLLLLISVALIAYGSRARVRGPCYVGGAGLFVFLFSAGLQVSARLSGHRASGSVLGWPLALLLVGAAVLALGFVGPRFTRARRAPDGSPAPSATSPPG